MLEANTPHHDPLNAIAVMLATLCQHRGSPYLLDQAKVAEVRRVLGRLDHRELKWLQAIIGAKVIAAAPGSEATTLLVAHRSAAVFAETRDNRRRASRLMLCKPISTPRASHQVGGQSEKPRLPLDSHQLRERGGIA